MGYWLNGFINSLLYKRITYVKLEVLGKLEKTFGVGQQAIFYQRFRELLH